MTKPFYIAISFCAVFHFTVCETLESRVRTLEDQVTKLSRSVKDCKSTGITRRAGNASEPVIAFSATISPPSITPVAIDENIVYDWVILNIGNAYNEHVGRFQAPHSGIYHFVATIMSYSSNYIEIEMVHDGNVLCRARASERYNAMGTCVANVYLSVGSDVWVRHYSNSGNYIYGNMFPSFAGHLIHTY